MNTHLETDIDLVDTFSALGELAENPLHLADFEDGTEDEGAFGDWNEEVECGALALDVECQGARLA